MAPHITNPPVEKTVRELTSLTGESMTDAIGKAAAERLERVKTSTPDRDPAFEEIVAMIRSYRLNPINEDLSDDEILGCGSDGLPE